MAKKPIMPGELKNLLSGVAQAEKKTEARQQETTARKDHAPTPAAVHPEAPAPIQQPTETALASASIERVIAYAQQYKESDIEMATVVLSDDMKMMLDKLKTSLPVKTPFKYLLSGIIREYFETHKGEITDLILRF